MPRWLERLVEIGSLPDDGHDTRLQKRTQVTMALASLPAVATWGLTFVAMGHAGLALFQGAYVAATGLMLALVAVTGTFSWFRWAHPIFVLSGPYALHWHLGGFRGSGGAFLWSLVAPMAAVIVRGPRRSLLHFAALLALLLFGLVREGPLAPASFVLTPSQISFQFTFNCIGAAAFIFVSTRYFMSRIEAEKGRAERLLHNILPAPIAERLKRDAGVIADRFEGVTVLFSDIVGFTPLSATLAPRDLVLLLDEIFSGFDRIADAFGLEKIKTIGDAYMVVGGLPSPCADHAKRVARAALAMRAFVAELASARSIDLSMRIGLHSGEVVAGVIGRRKFSYDLWGDTVNTASRMESHGAPGRVHISDQTRALLDGEFAFEDRGVITVKGKGEMRTWWLESRAAA